jgi:hypothetical protein
MNAAVIKNAIATLTTDVREAQEDLNVLERHEFSRRNDQEDESGDAEWHDEQWTEQRFGWRIERLFHRLRLLLEAAELPNALADLKTAWAGWESVPSKTTWLQEVDALQSDPLSYAQTVVETLASLSGSDSENSVRLQAVEGHLRSLPHLVSSQKKAVTKEEDIQVVMDHYFGLFFPEDYVRKPGVPGLLKQFEADGGVRSLSCLIELKHLRTADDLKRCIEEIAADTAGYRGSKDWSQFLAVFYMDQPFVQEEKIQGDLRRMGATNWKVIAVHGVNAPTAVAAPAPAVASKPSSAPVSTAPTAGLPAAAVASSAPGTT